MADLQGPKIRVGRFEGGRVELKPGARFVLDASCDLGNAERAGLDYKDLPKDVRPGDVLLLNDGMLVLDVEQVAGAEIVTKVRIGGELSNNKGINRQGGGLSAPALTAKDVRDIETAMECGADYVAVSFVRSRTDVEMARRLATIAGEKHGIRPLIIAKIERAEAIPALKEILDAADGIMVARGDLAVEVGNAAVPALQKRMIRMAREANKLAITATQRHPDFPTVPTMTEAGIAGFDNVGAWFGIVAPAGTPAAVVARLNSAIDRSLAKPEVRDRLVGLSMVPVGGPPAAFKAFLEQDQVRWSALIKAADIKVE